MRLPELRARPQAAERPSLATVRPTDLGLGAVAQDVQAWEGEVRQTRELEAEAQRAADEEAVKEPLNALKTGFEERFATAGAEWDGITPGFARGMDAAFDTAAAPVLNAEGWTPGQRDALQRGVSQYREATGQRAIQYQAQRRGALAAEQAQAREAVAVGGVMATYSTGVAEAFQAIDQEYDGSTGDYATRQLAEHDRVAGEVIAAAPENLRPRVTQELASTRLRLLGQAMDVEARAEQAFVANGVKSAGDGLVNAVLTAPSMYETNVAQVDQIVAGLPAAQRGAARAGLLNDMTEAYVSSLVRDGQEDAALTQLNSGALDGRLQPDTKARLLDAAQRKADELNIDDWMARLSLEGEIQDDIASRAATGVGVGVDAGRVASVLGPREAAQYLQAVQEAGKVHATTQGFAQMTPGAIRAQVAALKPEPGQADFAAAQGRYEQAARAGEAEIKLRETDGAGWAMRQAPSLQSDLSQIGMGDPQASRRAAARYAVGVLTLQQGADVDDKRILPKSIASGMVSAMMENPDRGAGLRGLGAVIDAFEAPVGSDGRTVAQALTRQRVVINELKAAGVDNGDLAAAMELGGDPVRMGRYVAATRTGAFDKLDRDDRREIEAATGNRLAAFFRSHDGLPPPPEVQAGRALIVERLAAERLATRGGSVASAVEEASNVLLDRYAFVGPQSWRMPAGLANSRNQGEVGQVLANRGIKRLVDAAAANQGASFYAPRDQGAGLNEAQRRQRYADSVRTGGRLMTTPDDAGLTLMHRGLDGRWTAALDRQGRPMVWTWAQAMDAGRTSGVRPAGGGGAAPRGIRNHNPGNIEHNPTSRWQGQTGHDGRFATFQTPEHGLRALSRDLGTKMARGQTTVRSILTQYAPPSENDTAAYIARVSRRLGVDPNARLDPTNAQVRAGLMAAIVEHENGRQPYGQALLLEAARMGMRR